MPKEATVEVKLIYLPTALLCEMNDDGIFIINQFFGQSDDDYWLEDLAINLRLIEQWRAWAAVNRQNHDWHWEATEIAYKANAIERHIWPETPRHTEGRTFLPMDILVPLDATRKRIIDEREKIKSKPATITVEELTKEEKALKDCIALKDTEIYHATTINKMLTDKYGAMPAQAAMRQVFHNHHWSN